MPESKDTVAETPTAEVSLNDECNKYRRVRPTRPGHVLFFLSVSQKSFNHNHYLPCHGVKFRIRCKILRQKMLKTK